MFPSDRFIRNLVTYGSTVTLLGACIAGVFFYGIPRQEQPYVATQKSVTFTAPLSTDIWGIFEVSTGTVLSGNKIDDVRPIASVTKLFTAYAVMESSHKNDAFSVNANDIATEGRSGKLIEGELTTPYMLLFPLLIESSNDAAIAIRRSLGEEYDTTLLDMSKSLELYDTKTPEPSGLSEADVSTVRELARFYSHLHEKHQHLIDITRVRTYIGLRTGYVNNNPVASLESFRGGKHGITDAAGKTFVGTLELKNGKEIGVILLGSSDLLHDIELLEKQGEVL